MLIAEPKLTGVPVLAPDLLGGETVLVINRARLAALSLVLCLGAAAPFATAAVRFVAPTGDDTNAGTEARPWKTLRKAAAAVQPGDTVRIKAGEYFVGPTWRVSRAGTAEGPITYRAHGDGQVRISNGSVVRAGAWKHLKNAIYSAQISQPVMAVFQDALPLHRPGDRARIFSVDDMIPNSFYLSGKTLYVWLEGGADPRKSMMRVTSGHVVSLYDSHHAGSISTSPGRLV